MSKNDPSTPSFLLAGLYLLGRAALLAFLHRVVDVRPAQLHAAKVGTGGLELFLGGGDCLARAACFLEAVEQRWERERGHMYERERGRERGPPATLWPACHLFVAAAVAQAWYVPGGGQGQGQRGGRRRHTRGGRGARDGPEAVADSPGALGQELHGSCGVGLRM